MGSSSSLLDDPEDFQNPVYPIWLALLEQEFEEEFSRSLAALRRCGHHTAGTLTPQRMFSVLPTASDLNVNCAEAPKRRFGLYDCCCDVVTTSAP